jgi:hypothetical protein
VAHFSSPKEWMLKHHLHHASHHIFTIKTPQRKPRFPEKPLQKPPTTSRKKNSSRTPSYLDSRSLILDNQDSERFRQFVVEAQFGVGD